MLDNKDVKLIHWSPDGEAFRVADSNAFSKHVLPNYFKHNNWQSFIRQLNIYGFMKLTDTMMAQAGITPTAGSASASSSGQPQTDWSFRHPLFLRRFPRRMEEIKRRTPKQPKLDYADSAAAWESAKASRAAAEKAAAATSGGSQSGASSSRASPASATSQQAPATASGSTSTTNSSAASSKAAATAAPKRKSNGAGAAAAASAGGNQNQNQISNAAAASSSSASTSSAAAVATSAAALAAAATPPAFVPSLSAIPTNGTVSLPGSTVNSAASTPLTGLHNHSSIVPSRLKSSASSTASSSSRGSSDRIGGGSGGCGSSATSATTVEDVGCEDDLLGSDDGTSQPIALIAGKSEAASGAAGATSASNGADGTPAARLNRQVIAMQRQMNGMQRTMKQMAQAQAKAIALTAGVLATQLAGRDSSMSSIQELQDSLAQWQNACETAATAPTGSKRPVIGGIGGMPMSKRRRGKRACPSGLATGHSDADDGLMDDDEDRCCFLLDDGFGDEDIEHHHQQLAHVSVSERAAKLGLGLSLSAPPPPLLQHHSGQPGFMATSSSGAGASTSAAAPVSGLLIGGGAGGVGVPRQVPMFGYGYGSLSSLYGGPDDVMPGSELDGEGTALSVADGEMSFDEGEMATSTSTSTRRRR